MIKIKSKDYNQIPIYENFVLEQFQKGYLPVSRVESWQEFNTLFSQESSSFIYRGHQDSSWTLSTSFSRLCNNPTEIEINEMLSIFKDTLKDMGLKDASGNFYHKYDEARLWGLGRHHGLLTPTLDWSYDPSVALFFAFEEPDNNDTRNPYAAIYLLNKNYILEHFKDKITIIDSVHPENYRAINQKGLFTLTASHVPLEDIIVDDQDNSHKYFRKIYVKRVEHKNCIRELDKQGINKKSLYPNCLEGAIHYSNLKARKFYRQTISGPLVAIHQRVVDPVKEKGRIATKLQGIYPNSDNTKISFAAGCIFEVFSELRNSHSKDSDFIKKLESFYNQFTA